MILLLWQMIFVLLLLSMVLVEFRRFHKGTEQGHSGLITIVIAFRMPLHAKKKRKRWVFNSLNQAV